MALAASSTSDQPTGLVNLASLVSSLAPIFLGSGKQTATTTTGGRSETGSTTTTTGGGSTTSATTTSPDILSALMGNVNTALSNASDPTKTTDLVNNIMRQAAISFAPTLGQLPASGLYNSSTINLLQNNAMANATAASTKAVLDYQTNQQQIATQGLNTLANTTKNTTTTTAPSSTNVTTAQTAAPSTSNTVTLKAPAVSPTQTLLGLAGTVIGNKLLGSKLISGLGDKAGDLTTSAVDAITSSLGVSNPLLSTGSNALLSAVNTASAAPLTTAVDAGGVPLLSSGAPAYAIPSAASSIAAPTGEAATDLALSASPGAIFADTAGPAALSGLSEGVADGAGAGLTAGLSAAELTGSGLELGGPGALAAGFASDSAIAGGAGASVAEGLGGGLAAGLTGAELASSGLELGGAGALAAGFASDAAITGGAGAALGAGAAAGGGLLEAIAPLLALVAWIICTELLRQKKMSASLYRYGLVHFNNYPEFGKRGYLLWARPIRDFIRKEPDSYFTKVVAIIFNLRVNNIAANAGCKFATWTYKGAVICSITYSVSWTLGLLILPFYYFSSTVRNYFSPLSMTKEVGV
jgi:hypothetical protein